MQVCKETFNNVNEITWVITIYTKIYNFSDVKTLKKEKKQLIYEYIINYITKINKQT